MSQSNDWKNGLVAITGRRHRKEDAADFQRPVGAGFFVSAGGHIATCAHVLRLGDWVEGEWESPIKLTLKATGDDALALVLEAYYDPDLDLAILALQGEVPEAINVLKLAGSRGSRSHTTLMWGYPAGHQEGLPGEGHVVEHAGDGRLQLSSAESTHGYSGSPVWDETWRRVIGMIQSGTKPDELGRLASTALALPAEALVAACPLLSLSPPAEPRPMPGAPAKPLQRPPRAEHFTGREKDLAWLLEALQPGRSVTIWAAGGMGKTALSAEALWQLAPGGRPPERFPDGLIFYSFYGRPDTALALEHIVKSFDKSAKDVSEDAARRELAGKQALLVLDGAEEAKDLAAVLRLRDSNGILITTRKKGDAPDPAWRRELKPLPGSQAVDLLNAWQEAEVGGDVGQAIVEQVGRLPLAVRLAGRYLEETGETPATYLRWLQESPIATMSAGEHREDSVAVLLEKSLEQVGELARLTLGVAGQLALTAFSWRPVAEALVEQERPLRQALNELVNYGLLGRAGEERYALSHALVHTYGRRRLAPSAETIERLAESYTQLAKQESEKGPEGYRRLDLERPHFATLLNNCLALGADEVAADLVWALDEYLDVHGHWLDRVQVLEMGRVAAVNMGDRANEMTFTGQLGFAYDDLEQVEQAIDHFEQALATSQVIGDRRSEGNYLGDLGNAHRAQGQLDIALEYSKQALAINQETGDRQAEGVVLGNLGIAYRALGQVDQAIEYYEQALAISQKIEDRRNEGIWLGNLGNAYSDLGQLDKAIEYAKQALAISREIGDRGSERNWLGNLGLGYRDLGRADEAIECFQQALAINQEIGDRPGEGSQLDNLGQTYSDLGQVDEAFEYYVRALAILEEVKSPYAEQVRAHLASLEEEA